MSFRRADHECRESVAALHSRRPRTPSGRGFGERHDLPVVGIGPALVRVCPSLYVVLRRAVRDAERASPGTFVEVGERLADDRIFRDWEVLVGAAVGPCTGGVPTPDA